jgi:hypothetical protein
MNMLEVFPDFAAISIISNMVDRHGTLDKSHHLPNSQVARREGGN